MGARRILLIIMIVLCITKTVEIGAMPIIQSESVILIDAKTKTILYEKNAYRPMNPASTTKILTTILLIENMNIDRMMEQTLQSKNNVPSDSSQIGLMPGDEFSLKDALYAIMHGSDNYVAYDAACVLDGNIDTFANRMNRKARQIGARYTHFVNPHGYYDPNHYTSAYDLALIGAYAFNNNTFIQIANVSNYVLEVHGEHERKIWIPNKTQLMMKNSQYYNPKVIGAKTGFCDEAGKTLVAVAKDEDKELVGVVLNAKGWNHYSDMNQLFNYGFQDYQRKVAKQQQIMYKKMQTIE